MAAGIVTGPNPEQGLAVADWMLYPSLFAGAVFNDNVYNTPVNRRTGLGIRVRPSLEANRDAGIHKTTIYASADMQFYPGRGQSYTLYPAFAILPAPTNVSARAGFAHVYEPLPDLKFTIVGDYTRSGGGLFGAPFGASSPLIAVPNGGALTALGTFANQFTGSLAVEKKLTDRAFVRASAGVQYVTYDGQPVNPWLTAFTGAPVGTALQNGLNYTGSLRAGFWVTPQIYAFVEPGADLRRYANSWNDTNGYRVIGGLGSDLIGLFRGEIYGGYQAQTSAHGYFGTTSSPAFGARLYYYPTRYLTFTASLDQTFTAPVAQPTGFAGAAFGVLPSAPSRTLQARLQADYAFSPYWTAFLRGGWGETRRSGGFGLAGFGAPFAAAGWTTARNTKSWAAGAGLSYTFWRNFALTLEYQFTKTSGNTWNIAAPWIPTAVAQNLVSVGLTYKY